MAKKERGALLTIWLSLLLILNLFGVIWYINVVFFLPNPPGVIYGFIFDLIFGILNVIFAAFLFMWKKWAFYGLVITSICFAVVSFYNQIPGGGILVLLGTFLLYLVLEPKWKFLK